MMKPKSLDKAMEDDAYWHILMQVLIGEYVKAFPEAIHKLKPDVPESDVLENDVPKPELSIAN